MHTIGEKKIRMLNPREIKRPQNTVRTDFNLDELNLLRDSISASGVLQPLLVRRVKRGTYQLISGNRRLQAALMAGLRRVPCVVHSADDTTALLYSLTENLQSSRLSFFDEARTMKNLLTAQKMSLGEMSARLGISQSEINSKLQVLRIDERLAQRITEAHLTEAHTKALLRLPKEGRAQVLDTVIRDNLNANDTEKYIFSILNPFVEEQKPKPQEKSVRKFAIGDPRIFSNSLTKLVDSLKTGGVKVTFRKSESEKYTEYKIRIKKEAPQNEELLQMKIC